ncbi:bleomycin resistance protein [Xylophilus rhododendri]|uniref:Bleomycin resistance protein n=1 Tax=Xylophilus rhododendri TaxID=2697032 RepID=A0A857J994_9BURK|nr:VOC family protein [Xylophilus rhododendri]QHI99793.1 bleomycin resistance protein [Xylophilus rhododendri]
MKLWFNLFCRDPQAQLDFYTALLGWPEAVASRSPIYRAVEQDGVQIGFNAPAAYALLGLAERQPIALPAPVTAYATFMLDCPADVDAAAAHAARHGGSVLKPPYATYYGQWQAVLADPEGHVFRASCAALPEGVAPAARPA